MFALRQFVVLLVLALWLPATQHCGLEAAGLIGSHGAEAGDACCGSEDADCAYDACQAAERFLHRSDGDAFQISEPERVDADLFTHVLLGWRERSLDLSVPVVERRRPSAWLPTRHFVLRAAPLSRAPSSVA